MDYFNLPDYELILWLKHDESGQKLEDEVLSVLNGFRICNDLIVKGIKICHW